MSKEIEKAVNVVAEQDFDQVDYGRELSAEDYDFDDLYGAWQDAAEINRYRGTKVLETTVYAIGYPDLEEFFDDNPGVIEEIEKWLLDNGDRIDEWKEALLNAIQELGGELPRPQE